MSRPPIPDPIRRGLAALCGLVVLAAGGESSAADAKKLFARENLVAWCIVPFDASKRGPAERAEMLVKLGLKKCAYDWRAEHVPTFEDEIREYQKHGIEFFAFWDAHDEAFKLFEQYDLHPQVWKTCPSPDAPASARSSAPR